MGLWEWLASGLIWRRGRQLPLAAACKRKEQVMEMSPSTLVLGDCLQFVNTFHNLRFLLISWLFSTKLSFQVYSLDGGIWLCSQAYASSQVSPPDGNNAAHWTLGPTWKSPGNTNHCLTGPPLNVPPPKHCSLPQPPPRAELVGCPDTCQTGTF